MKTLRILFIGCALLLTHLLAAQSYLQDTIPQTVVTATGTQHLLKDVPVQTEVITSKMLENYAGRSLEDILGGLGYSWLDTDANQYDAEHDQMRQVTIDGTAHHKGNLFVTWNHRFSPDYRLSAGLYGRMSSKRHYQIDGDGEPLDYYHSKNPE